MVFFSGFAKGMIFASFHVCGILFVLIAMLYVCVRYLIAFLTRCFRCCMLMLSGPSEFLFLVCLSACFVSLSVMWKGCVCMFFICLCVVLFVLFV